MKNHVFIVQHVHVHEDGSEDIKLIGAFSSKELAVSAVKELSTDPGFCDLKEIHTDESDATGSEQGFHINSYEVDKIHWEGGYVTL